MTANGCSAIRLQIDVLSSHFLVLHYLTELLLHLDIEITPVVLHDLSSNLRPLPALADGVIILDLHDLPLPVSTYIDAISGRNTSSAFLAIGRQRDAGDVADLLLGGVNGFLSYEDVPCYLGPAIISLAHGDTWAKPDVMRRYMTMTSRRSFLSDAGTEALTKREGQVRELLTRRYSNKEIATSLGICESTVKFHVSNVLAKLNAPGRRDLARKRDGSLVLPMVRKCG